MEYVGHRASHLLNSGGYISSGAELSGRLRDRADRGAPGHLHQRVSAGRVGPAQLAPSRRCRLPLQLAAVADPEIQPPALDVHRRDRREARGWRLFYFRFPPPVRRVHVALLPIFLQPTRFI